MLFFVQRRYVDKRYTFGIKFKIIMLDKMCNTRYSLKKRKKKGHFHLRRVRRFGICNGSCVFAINHQNVGHHN